MITIAKPRIRGNRLIAEITEGEDAYELYFEVAPEFVKYFCAERADAFAVALIQHAMRSGQDIKSEAPVSYALLHNINEILIPALSDNDNRLFASRVFADMPKKGFRSEKAVGASLSCGVDSFYTILKQREALSENMRISHLLFLDFGFWGKGQEDKFEADYRNCRLAAEELELPLVRVSSNIFDQYGHLWYRIHAYCLLASVYSLQKLFGAYFVSSGYRFTEFGLKDNSLKNADWYALLWGNTLVSENMRLFLDGQVSRFKKTEFISQYRVAQKYLSTCWRAAPACGICSKCIRTLTSLDVLGRLDAFSNVFDIESYKANREYFLGYLVTKGLRGDDYFSPVLKHCRETGFALPPKLELWFAENLKKHLNDIYGRLNERNINAVALIHYGEVAVCMHDILKSMDIDVRFCVWGTKVAEGGGTLSEKGLDLPLYGYNHTIPDEALKTVDAFIVCEVADEFWWFDKKFGVYKKPVLHVKDFLGIRYYKDEGAN
jgi:hypothetical protein